MEKNTLFDNDILLPKNIERPSIQQSSEEVNSEKFFKISEKEKPVVLSVILVLLLVVLTNIIYFLYDPHAVGTTLLFLFIVNAAAIGLIFFVKRKNNKTFRNYRKH